MHRRTHLAAHALLIAAAALGCGPTDDTASQGLALRFSDAAALGRTASIAIQFYRSDGSADHCTRLRTTRPRLRADLGPYRQSLDDTARMNGTLLSRDDVPVGAWAVLVDATDAEGTLVGAGCAQDQQVVEGERSGIAVVIDAVP